MLGCNNSKHKFAPVSGVVTLNGQPLAKALVSFQPVVVGNGVDAGVGSTGTTNDKGEFTLKAATGETGAIVGKHRVVITLVEAQVGATDERPPRGGWPQKEKIPARYNSDSNETYDVPSGGTTSANFPLTSP
jgi:hypothetical protein